jgi:4'-phosphopantetheinyl transferase
MVGKTASELVKQKPCIFTVFSVSHQQSFPMCQLAPEICTTDARREPDPGLTTPSAASGSATSAGESREPEVADIWCLGRVVRLRDRARRPRCAGPLPPNLDGAGRVELWFVPAGAHRLLAQDARILDREDWQAIARVRDEHARDLLRATRITLRRALSHAVGNQIQPEAWRFQTSAYGKPQVTRGAGLPRVQFCVSHIDTMAVIAVSRDAPVGVDIETIGQSCDATLIEGFCSPRERRALAHLNGPHRARAFARLWTLKEAYAKLTGTGLAADFRFLEFGAGPELFSVACQTQHGPGEVTLQSWLTQTPAGSCQVAVAVGGAAAGPGELVCFAVEDGDDRTRSRSPNPEQGVQAGLRAEVAGLSEWRSLMSARSPSPLPPAPVQVPRPGM